MSNHTHLVVSAKSNDTSDILRDFKKFTNKRIIAAVKNNQQESRKEWMLKVFKREGTKNSRNSNYQFGGRITNPKNVTVSSLQIRNWITFIIIL
jgi:REP element-mobilizing transposase RayT